MNRHSDNPAHRRGGGDGSRDGDRFDRPTHNRPDPGESETVPADADRTQPAEPDEQPTLPAQDASQTVPADAPAPSRRDAGPTRRADERGTVPWPGPDAESASPGPAVTDPTMAPLVEAGLLAPPDNGTSLALLDGRYEVQRLLGQGGMGVVLLARDREHGNAHVAIKTIRPKYLRNRAIRRQFIAEAQQMNELPHHDHIVQIRGVGTEERPYLVMECLSRGSLADRLRQEGGLDRGLTVRLAHQVALAVEAVHSITGRMHRDLKPDNVLLTDDDQAKLSDFGLVREVGVGDRGLRAGTLLYMPPEVLAGSKDVGFEWDVYSLGATMYEMLVGRPPYADLIDRAKEEGRPLDPVDAVAAGPPTPIRELAPRADRFLVQVTDSAMARQPRDRYKIGDLVKDLQRLAEGKQPLGPGQQTPLRVLAGLSRRHPAIASLVALVIAASLGLGVLAVNRAPSQETAREQYAAFLEVLDGADRQTILAHAPDRWARVQAHLSAAEQAQRDGAFAALYRRSKQGQQVLFEAQQVASDAARAAERAQAAEREKRREAAGRLLGSVRQLQAQGLVSQGIRDVLSEQWAEADRALDDAERALAAGRFERADARASRARELLRGIVGFDEAAVSYQEQVKAYRDGLAAFGGAGWRRVQALRDEIDGAAPRDVDAAVRRYREELLPMLGELVGKVGPLFERFDRARTLIEQGKRAGADEALGILGTEVLPVAQDHGRARALMRTARLRVQGFTNSLGMKFVYVEPGSFVMGSDRAERERFARNDRELANLEDEQPRRVALRQGFYVSVHEVTREQFARFVGSYRDEQGDSGYVTEAERGANPVSWKWVADQPIPTPGMDWRAPTYRQGPDHPVVCVTLADAKAFAAWLTGLEADAGRAGLYRLPHEDEWEYACRAGTRTAFAWGDGQSLDTPDGPAPANNGLDPAAADEPDLFDTLPEDAVFFAVRDGAAFTAPVGSYPANAWGIHDMHGNVWEWTNSRHPMMTDRYVVRGGGYNGGPVHNRSAYRYSWPPRYRDWTLGFRVVWEPRAVEDGPGGDEQSSDDTSN